MTSYDKVQRCVSNQISNTPFPIAALFDFMEKLAIPRKRKVFDILQ